MGSQEENKMRSRTSWSWSRPTCHIYAYNRELNHLNAASALTAQAETSRRSTRASSVIASGESSSAARLAERNKIFFVCFCLIQRRNVSFCFIKRLKVLYLCQFSLNSRQISVYGGIQNCGFSREDNHLG